MSNDQAEAGLLEFPVIEIRDCHDSDAQEVLPLLHQLWADAERDDVMLQAAFQQRARSEAGHFLCATAGGKIVGFCSLSVRESLWQQGLLGHVDELVVDKTYRARGIGTQLLRRVEEIARQMGCRRIELDSAFHRTQAHAFYERLGYTKRAFLFSKPATELTCSTTERNLQPGSVGQSSLDEARQQLALDSPSSCARNVSRFAEQSCRGQSPLYEHLCSRTADDDGLIQIVKDTPEGQPVPNLFLAAVHFLLLSGAEHELGSFYGSCVNDPKPPKDAFPAFREFCLASDHRSITAPATQSRNASRARLPAGLRVRQRRESLVHRRWRGGSDHGASPIGLLTP